MASKITKTAECEKSVCNYGENNVLNTNTSWCQECHLVEGTMVNKETTSNDTNSRFRA